MRIIKKIQENTAYHIARMKRKNKDTVKIFCIGRNKTGTTSLAAFFKANGYKVGNQEQAEQLMEDWVKRDFTRIIDYCKTAEVFQDIPFSLPDTYRALDAAYPNSKFILTIRSSAEEWYHSRITHHIKKISKNGKLPTEEELREYKYRNKRKGFILFMQKSVYGYPSVPLYDKQAYMANYENHNARVVEYFENRPDDLLILNLEEDGAFEKLCWFAGLDPLKAKPIPHKNRSEEM
jgi:hypothetical protein